MKPLILDINSPRELNYTFEIGVAPELELKAIDKNNKYERYLIAVEDKRIDEEFKNLQKQLGERTSVEDSIEDEDLLYIKVIELEEGEIKPGGILNETSILASKMSESLLGKVKKLKKGASFETKLMELEAGADTVLLEKYILGLDKDAERNYGEDFKIEINDVVRVIPAEVDDALFAKAFPGGAITTEEGAREEIKKTLQVHLDNRSDSLLFAEIQRDIKDSNDASLPDDFLKRWLKFSNQEMNEEKLSEEYGSFFGRLKMEFDTKCAH